MKKLLILLTIVLATIMVFAGYGGQLWHRKKP